MFSRRSATERQQNVLYVALTELQQAGRRYHDLTVSNPTAVELPGLVVPGSAGSVAQILARADCSRYEPSAFGMPLAREAVALHFAQIGVDLSPDRALVTASTSESYSFLFNLLCDAGDEILIPTPSYPLFEYLARFSNVQVKPYRLAYDGAWHIDFDSISAAMSSRTRAMVLVNPNNPTGSYVSKEEWQRLGQLGVPLISDEVFARYPLCDDPARPSSALCVLQEPEQPVFALDGLSKYAGLPQLKLGMVAYACPQTMQDELSHRLEMIADTFLSVSTPVQAALPELLRAGSIIHAAIAQRLTLNLTQLQRTLGGSAATVLRAEGGWSAVIRLPSVMSEQEWVLRLLQQHGVLVQPGWFYDFVEEPFIVVSLLTGPQDFAIGVGEIFSACADA